MSGNIDRNRHIRALAHAAADMLAADPALRVADAAKLVGVGESTIRLAWHAAYPGHPRRPVHRSSAFREARAAAFAVLYDVMLDHVPSRVAMPAAEIFAAMRDDYGSVGERRLWRALRRLVDTGQVARHGMRCTGATYTRSRNSGCGTCAN